MKIRCPNCFRISEIPHVEHGRRAECSCRTTFTLDDSTIIQEYSLPDEVPPPILGRCPIKRFIGRGGMSSVYEGVHPELGIPVAVKTLLPEYADDLTLRDRFYHAARICARITHPNVVKVYEAGKDESGRPFLMMEYLSGGTLADAMAARNSFPAKEAAEIAASVCRALVVNEQYGIVHRDIKPDNIMISGDGQYKLTDLGLAKLDPAAQPGSGARVLDEGKQIRTGKMHSFGTLEYMSPEQYIDSASCDIRSDIYSLGATMYQLAAGRLPFETENRAELRRLHLTEDPYVPSEYMPGLPIDFDYISVRCLQKNRADRYQNAAELLADLEAFLTDAPLPSTHASFTAPTPMRTPAPRSSRLTAVMAVLLVMILIVGAALFFSPPPAVPAPVEAGTGVPFADANDARPMTADPVRIMGQEQNSVMTATAEVVIKNEDKDEKERKYFQDAVKSADDAIRNKTGFLTAIENLEGFTRSEEYGIDALNRIAELKKSSETAVNVLMSELDSKAAPFLESGEFNKAANVYKTDIGPLEPESRARREQKINELNNLAASSASPLDSSRTKDAPL